MGKRKQKVCQTNGKYEYKQLQVKGSNNMDMNRQKIMIPSNICFLGSLVHCRRSWLEQWEWGRWLWFWVKYPFCEWWFIMNIWYQITTRVHIMIMIMMHAGNKKMWLCGKATLQPSRKTCGVSISLIEQSPKIEDASGVIGSKISHGKATNFLNPHPSMFENQSCNFKAVLFW